MTSITEFIEARLAEDEDALLYPTRLRDLRQSDAMHNLVGIANGWIERDFPMFDLVLRALAYIWADHPDYQERWET
jgi:hypothetical protein